MFLADLARRLLLLTGLLIFLVPLTSLFSSGLSLTAVQLTEALVLAFIVVALARSILDGRLFIDAQLARPAMTLAALVGISGLCSAFEQTADASMAIRGLWRSARSYFANPDTAYKVQPTLRWLEFAALAPLVELSVRRLPWWKQASQARPRKRVLAIVLFVLVAMSAVVTRLTASDVALALEAARQAPIFGIGPGGAAWTLPNPESTYWLPLVILVDLGCIGLVTVTWLVWTAMTRSDAQRPRRWVEWAVLVVVLISVPWRITEALSPGTAEVVGAGPVEPAIEGIEYRVVQPVSRWRLRPRTRTVVALMRWDPAGAFQCRVRIAVRDRPADEVSLRSDMWIPVRFSVPPGSRPGEQPEVEFQVSSRECRLLVGTVTATR